MGRRSVTAAATLAVLTAPALAAAAPAWLTPADQAPLNVSPVGTDVSDPVAVAMDGTGGSVAVWRDAASGSVKASVRGAGGAFAAPATLGTASTQGLPRVAVNAGGDAVAIWLDSGKKLVKSAYRPAGGAWGPAVNVGDPVDTAFASDATRLLEPQVVIDAAGRSAAIWRDAPGFIVVRAATRTAGAGGAWSASPIISPVDRNADGLDLSVNATGVLAAAFIGDPTGGDIPAAQPRAEVTVGTTSSGLPACAADACDLFTPQADEAGKLYGGEDTQVAVRPDGGVVALWRRFKIVTPAPGRVGNFVIEGATRAPGGSFGAPILVPHAGAIASSVAPQLAVDGAGNAMAVWWRFAAAPTRPNNEIEYATLGAGAGAWSAVAPLTAGEGDATSPALAVNAAGKAIVAWQDKAGGTRTIRASFGTVTGGLNAPQRISGTDAGGTGDVAPQVGIDAAGDGIAAWRGIVQKTVKATGLDDGGPALGGLALPASATVGATVTGTVAAADVWSGLAPGSPAWSFGDGATAAGGTVTHVYSAPGTYTVTITATDALGNVTSTTRSIAVTTAAAGGGLPGGGTVGLGPVRIGLTTLSASPARFRTVNRKGTKAGTTLSFRLSSAATVRLTVITKKGKALGSLTVKGRAGKNTVRFTGKLRGKALAPGSYRIRLQAGTGPAKSLVKVVSITVLRK